MPDVEKAVEFYSEVMGWHQIMEPTVVTDERDTPIGQMCIDLFGRGWGSFKLAHMPTGDNTGVEMFELKNNEIPKNFEYWKTSTFHFCVQDPEGVKACFGGQNFLHSRSLELTNYIQAGL